MSDDSEVQDSFTRGYHDIPDSSQLESMSFAELASEISTCQAGSAKYIVIEREIKRHLANDQAKMNRKNILLGVLIGGVFTIAGTFLGAYLRIWPQGSPTIQSCEPTTPAILENKQDLPIVKEQEKSAEQQNK